MHPQAAPPGWSAYRSRLPLAKGRAHPVRSRLVAGSPAGNSRRARSASQAASGTFPATTLHRKATGKEGRRWGLCRWGAAIAVQGKGEEPKAGSAKAEPASPPLSLGKKGSAAGPAQPRAAGNIWAVPSPGEWGGLLSAFWLLPLPSWVLAATRGDLRLRCFWASLAFPFSRFAQGVLVSASPLSGGWERTGTSSPRSGHSLRSACLSQRRRDRIGRRAKKGLFDGAAFGDRRDRGSFLQRFQGASSLRCSLPVNASCSVAVAEVGLAFLLWVLEEASGRLGRQGYAMGGHILTPAPRQPPWIQLAVQPPDWQMWARQARKQARQGGGGGWCSEYFSSPPGGGTRSSRALAGVCCHGPPALLFFEWWLLFQPGPSRLVPQPSSPPIPVSRSPVLGKTSCNQQTPLAAFTPPAVCVRKNTPVPPTERATSSRKATFGGLRALPCLAWRQGPKEQEGWQQLLCRCPRSGEHPLGQLFPHLGRPCQLSLNHCQTPDGPSLPPEQWDLAGTLLQQPFRGSRVTTDPSSHGLSCQASGGEGAAAPSQPQARASSCGDVQGACLPPRPGLHELLGLTTRAGPRPPNGFPVCFSVDKVSAFSQPSPLGDFPIGTAGAASSLGPALGSVPRAGAGRRFPPAVQVGRVQHKESFSGLPFPSLPRKECLATRIAVQACNCSRYVKVSKERMALLKKQSGCWTGEDGEACLGDPGPTATAEPSRRLTLHQPACSPGWEGLEAAGPGDERTLLPTGIRLRVEAVPPGVLSKEELDCFYCCSQCGQVFWEGSHLGRLVSQFREVLDLPEES
ncbi:exonuclease mut-7 like [Crotalus adamanteus]|uniref:Exonuclease mut-7 like n=1 Tax=Crotalus adamanteus TaxID=8729 RepID=A0AAW1AR80_CROAD